MCLFVFLAFFGRPRQMFFFMSSLGLIEITEWEPCSEDTRLLFQHFHNPFLGMSCPDMCQRQSDIREAYRGKHFLTKLDRLASNKLFTPMPPIIGNH